MQHLLFFSALNLWVCVCVSEREREWAFEDQGGKQAEAKLHRRGEHMLSSVTHQAFRHHF